MNRFLWIAGGFLVVIIIALLVFHYNRVAIEEWWASNTKRPAANPAATPSSTNLPPQAPPSTSSQRSVSPPLDQRLEGMWGAFEAEMDQLQACQTAQQVQIDGIEERLRKMVEERLDEWQKQQQQRDQQLADAIYQRLFPKLIKRLDVYKIPDQEIARIMRISEKDVQSLRNSQTQE